MDDSLGAGVSLKVQGVAYEYRGAPRPALADVSFQTEGGKVLGVVGPNGSGKTTLFRLLLGFVRPHAGTVTIGEQDAAGYRQTLGVGYLPESVVLPPDVTVRQLAIFMAHLEDLGPAEAEEAIQRHATTLDLNDVMWRRTKHLSHGYRQRVGLLLALLGDPGLVLLDEPANGLDPHSIGVLRSLLRRLRRRAATVLVSSHNLLELQRVCDEVVLLSQGRLLGHSSREELTSSPDIYVVQVGPETTPRSVDMHQLRRLGGVRFAVDEYAFPSEESARRFADGADSVELIERRESDLEYLFHSLVQASDDDDGAENGS